MTTTKVQATTEKVQASRRKFIKRAAYIPPAILTLAVAPRYAKSGSQNAQGNQNQNQQ